ncbi:hypothetical protein [Burkholderia territorii]|uniref:hypothetical protein n=1 Tax=Burkholderia territorii TaxID=1503055 RepID=UPI0012D93E0C|nr:hypothetical protein [Burkholderia territorii]
MTDSVESGARRAPIHFASREEFESRPAYVPSLRCDSTDLEYIVGKYGFSTDKKLQCGLNGCNAWHQHGFVIATKSGVETHCGQDCGRREFHVAWDDLHAEFQRQEKALARRSLVATLLQERNQILDDATTLGVELAAACSKIRSIYDELRKEPLLARQFDNALQSDGRILAAVESDSSIGAARGQRGKNANIAVVGRIQGILAAQKYQTIGRILEWGVIRPLREISEQSVDLLSDDRVAEKAKSVQSIRQELSAVVEFVGAARQFLAPSNVIEITKLKRNLPSKARTARLDRILARLPALFS